MVGAGCPPCGCLGPRCLRKCPRWPLTQQLAACRNRFQKRLRPRCQAQVEPAAAVQPLAPHEPPALLQQPHSRAESADALVSSSSLAPRCPSCGVYTCWAFSSSHAACVRLSVSLVAKQTRSSVSTLAHERIETIVLRGKHRRSCNQFH